MEVGGGGGWRGEGGGEGRVGEGEGSENGQLNPSMSMHTDGVIVSLSLSTVSHSPICSSSLILHFSFLCCF